MLKSVPGDCADGSLGVSHAKTPFFGRSNDCGDASVRAAPGQLLLSAQTGKGCCKKWSKQGSKQCDIRSSVCTRTSGPQAELDKRQKAIVWSPASMSDELRLLDTSRRTSANKTANQMLTDMLANVPPSTASAFVNGLSRLLSAARRMPTSHFDLRPSRFQPRQQSRGSSGPP